MAKKILFKHKIITDVTNSITGVSTNLVILFQKSKITKILNSEKNLLRKVPNQMIKSNDKTHQTNRQQLSYS